MAFAKILRDDQTDINSNDIWRFAFHSDYKTLKIHKSGQTSATISAGNNNTTKTIIHSLGYEPNFFVYILKNGRLWETYGSTPCSLSSEIPSDIGNVGAYGYASVDNNNLYIEIELLGAATANNNEVFTIYYAIQLDQE